MPSEYHHSVTRARNSRLSRVAVKRRTLYKWWAGRLDRLLGMANVFKGQLFELVSIDWMYSVRT